MIDIETLGTRPGSVILSLGAVGFNRDDGTIDPSHFHMVVSVQSALKFGATIDAATVRWWRDRPAEAQALVWKAMAGGDELDVVMRAFADWLTTIGETEPHPRARRKINIWGKGSDFDNILVRAACEQAGVPLPWGDFSNRCFRTLCDDHRDLEPVRDGVHHDALDDAIHQARWACKIIAFQRRAWKSMPTFLGVDWGRAQAAAIDPSVVIYDLGQPTVATSPKVA